MNCFNIIQQIAATFHLFYQTNCKDRDHLEQKVNEIKCRNYATLKARNQTSLSRVTHEITSRNNGVS